MKYRLSSCAILGLVLTISTIATIQSGASQKKLSLFTFLSLERDVSIQLSFDVAHFKSNKLKSEPYNGLFSIYSTAKNNLVLGCEVLIRGDYRRKHFDFPPFHLNFDRSQLKDMSFKKVDDFKFVSHCMNKKGSAQTLIKEYLAYQIYATLTDYAYQTLLLPISYLDITNGKRKESFVIMLESDDDLVGRLGAKWSKQDIGKPELIDAYSYETFAYFNI
ncbi:MAG: hypothetical protein HKN87_14375 [Saprospiraceae bacterium]|nr:hypothetical protein [Saprospiraceae bacterium]